MATLQEVIQSVSAKVKRFGDRRLGEQNTKASLIEPVLEALGWDIRDPDEVHREFRPTGKDSPVDYALKLVRRPRLFLEAKGLGETLADRRWIAQVLGYATVAGVEWCVLTDGDEYRFYNATAPIDAEEKMLCRIRLSECAAEASVETLNLMSRANLEENLLEVLWQSHFVDRRVKAALLEMLSPPTAAVVRLIRSKVPKLAPKEIAASVRRLDIRVEAPSGLSAITRTKRTDRPAKPPKQASPRAGKGATTTVTIKDLVDAGLLQAPLRLFCTYKGRSLEAKVLTDGQVEFQGTKYASCSTAAEFARGTVTGKRMNTNGWVFWQYADGSGATKQLDAARRVWVERNAGGGVASSRRTGRSG